MTFLKILFLISNSGKISKGKKPFKEKNLICYISETEVRRKFKFVEVGLVKFCERKSSKKISDLNALFRNS